MNDSTKKKSEKTKIWSREKSDRTTSPIKYSHSFWMNWIMCFDSRVYGSPALSRSRYRSGSFCLAVLNTNHLDIHFFFSWLITFFFYFCSCCCFCLVQISIKPSNFMVVDVCVCVFFCMKWTQYKKRVKNECIKVLF